MVEPKKDWAYFVKSLWWVWIGLLFYLAVPLSPIAFRVLVMNLVVFGYVPMMMFYFGKVVVVNLDQRRLDMNCAIQDMRMAAGLGVTLAFFLFFQAANSGNSPAVAVAVF